MMTRWARSVEPTAIALNESFYLEGPPRPEDASAHRLLALDPDAARFFGWTIEQARSQPASYFDEIIQQFVREWHEGRTFNFSIRRRGDGNAVGAVELRLSGDEANVSYLVAAELRGHGLATHALEALLTWGARELALDQVNLACHVENVASRRVAEKCKFVFLGYEGDELKFRREFL